ncbi:MAG: hypothetical protein HZB67_05800 [Candidatus Aenigmarchaeota archaeon]|nr:hypothetical protein [Candidatus Aenigmarchaeota archaeon]
MPELLNAYEAAAHAARIAGAQLAIGNNEITDHMKSFMDFICKYDDSDVDAAIAAALSGNRVFAAKHVNMKNAARMRAPIVGMSEHAPYMRDSGALIFLPESSQELLDDIIIAYGVCENKKVALPVLIGMDFLSIHTRETIDIPTPKIIENFLPARAAEKIEKLHAVGENIETKAQLFRSMGNAKKLLDEEFERFRKKFRRPHSNFEKFMLNDAELAIVTYGPCSGNAKLAVQHMRDSGEKAGLLRLHVMRPFPEIKEVLKDVKKIAVVEPSLSIGYGGILHSELGIGSSFISGEVISVKNFEDIFRHLKKMEKPERIWMM